jgi:repressor of nif and glnA expression
MSPTTSAILPESGSAADLVREHPDRYGPILIALRDQPWRELLSSRDLMDALTAQGLEPSERTLRLHLQELCDGGLLVREGRRGYRLSEAGQVQARSLTANRRLGSVLYRMEETACSLDFDPATGLGSVSVNACLVPLPAIEAVCDALESVFAAGLAVGERVLVSGPGGELLGRAVPDGMVGLGTMCSLTLASVLMRRGVPSHPIFGGLLHVAGGAPAHFLEMIRYDSTSLSPNEVFIRAGMTSVGAAATSGTGAITASFREVPMAALPRLRAVAAELGEHGFPGILHIGRPGMPVLNIPVHEGRVGVVLATGLNPLACLWERGLLDRGPDGSRSQVDAGRPMVGPAPYADLIPHRGVRDAVRRILSTPSTVSA